MACRSASATASADTFSNSNVTTSTRLRERAHRVEIVVRRVDLFVGDLAGRRVVVGRQRVDAIAEPAGRHGEHAPKLTAAQDADGGTWKYHNF